jgi:C4-dicarboxylate transporter, DctM subunit
VTPLEMGFLGIVILFIFLFSGIPLGIAFMVVGFVGYTFAYSFDGALGLLRTVPYSTFASYDFSVIPLFILMGSIAFASRLSEDLYAGAHGVLGTLKGGLAMATIAACGAFAAISGSSVATAATMGKVALPEMRKYKYDSALATGAIAAGGTIGILIPPSVIFIIYGIVAEQSIGRLYMAGFIPGILQVFLFILTIGFMCWRKPLLGPPGPKNSFKGKMKSLGKMWSAGLLFIIVIGGIYLGWFSANEAAGIGAFLAFIIGLSLKRLTWRGFKNALLDTAKDTAMIFLIVTGALIFGYFLTVTGVGLAISQSMASLAVNKYIIFAMIVVIYLVLGCLMDSLAMILITVPIFYPLMKTLGFDPIWFGVVIVIVTELGLITPPVGMNVFVIKGIAKDVPMYTIFKGITPFVIADLLLIVLITVWPEIALFLPGTMMGKG